LIGSPAEIKKMFEIAVKHDIKPWIQERPMADAQQAVQGKSNLLRLGISSLILVHP
jgi:D-arabinose 1-dehydrogenase-like Zn-dependent alcohol dehydrogenase